MAKKKKKKKNDQPEVDPEFGLSAPTGEMAQEGEVRPPVEHSAPIKTRKPIANPDEKYKAMNWKGFEEEEEDDDPQLSFGGKMDREEDDLDMTPMVDVTFLLLIFFMVTASFTLQKSIEQPPSTTDDPSTKVQEAEDEDDYVEVIIDQTNTFYVTSRDAEEEECATVRQMRAKVKDAKDSLNAKRMIITAHVESKHFKVVAAYDAAMAFQIERVEIRTTEEDF